ncbi:MAG: serine/threonine protein kinase [Deltaproteobacteria bacterium]|nr:serine/threonine protein kinase [Deltaproteobacteria bacterium]
MDRDDEISGIFDPPYPAAIPPEERATTIAGRYRIVERIGEGGMGQVLRVSHRRLGKAFALKLMQAELSLDPGSRGVFHREARLASSLSHPNIVSVVDFGEDPDWGLFIVMEFLEGEPLSERIDRLGKLPIPVVCNVARQLASALHHSHEHNVIHADLKAANLLCVHDPNFERRKWTIKLLDFGMAHFATKAGGLDERIAGTPEYMAPERITGGKPQPSVDIYALGIIIYEMLAGSVPFFGGTATEILKRHLQEPPQALSERRGEQIDSALEAIVIKALAKDPGQRYQTAAEIQADLRGFMRELGLKKRDSERVRAPTGSEASREEIASLAFDLAGIPMAGLRADGTVVVANSACARLLKLDLDELEGGNILETVLATIHPGLPDDLRVVAMDGKVVRRRITVRLGEKQSRMRLLMNPAEGRAGDCMLAMHALPAKKK